MSIQFYSKSTEETIAFGKKLSRYLAKGDIVCLFGDLGSGKTMLVKGMAKGLGVDPQKVHSPTFVFLNAYAGKKELFHFDLYRIERTEEILALGYEEFLFGEGISVVEWAERLEELMPKEYLKIKLEHKGEEKRFLSLSAKGKRYRALLEKISQ